MVLLALKFCPYHVFITHFLSLFEHLFLPCNPFHVCLERDFVLKQRNYYFI